MIGAEPIRVGGLTYWQIKVRALNGHRDRLSAEQLQFVGVDMTTVISPQAEVEVLHQGEWLTPVNPRTIDDRLDSLASLMDRAPNYLALAREILNEK